MQTHEIDMINIISKHTQAMIILIVKVYLSAGQADTWTLKIKL
ncbi:hypothetical protein SAMN04488057_105323 [Cyclobacterium lianum]|uniref:Uncharacterized protein n=1 Tax=Cyclobacterium lianum TaxID=388280 RepID=A0A1M7NHA0_9BACT|nr:hypothetical protein [Cyclobacterium lianum]SHN03084.1 hypothetical protein SAMN04488057_105323 [Cyclobacterium lianum]